MSRKTTAIILGILAAGIVIGCILQSVFLQRAKKEYQKDIFAMDTFMSFAGYGPKGEAATEAVVQRIQELDRLLSAEDSRSEVRGLNQAGSLTVSAEVQELLRVSQEIYEQTGGAFDPTIYPLMQLWGFPQKQYRVPGEAEIDAVLPYVNLDLVKVTGAEVTLGEGQALDFGGIAKGFSSAEAIRIYKEASVKSALVSLGGNIQTLGYRPDGEEWLIGIRDPQTGGVRLGVHIHDSCVITSGGYERYFEAEDQTFIHILDPKTGYPVQNDLASVSIISEDGTKADALSTALFVMGYERGAAFWKEHADEFEVVWILEDGSAIVTEGLAEKTVLMNGEDFRVLNR